MRDEFDIRPYRGEDRGELELLELPEKYINQYTNSPPLHYTLSMLGVCTNYLYLMTRKSSSKVVGTILLRKRLDPLRAGYSWKMHAVYVSPELRGKGLGIELVQYVLQELDRRHVQEVGLNVDEDNKAAIGLYLKCGFSEKEKKNGQLILVKRLVA